MLTLLQMASSCRILRRCILLSLRFILCSKVTSLIKNGAIPLRETADIYKNVFKNWFFENFFNFFENILVFLKMFEIIFINFSKSNKYSFRKSELASFSGFYSSGCVIHLLQPNGHLIYNLCFAYSLIDVVLLVHNSIW